jgi:hypothetical protein
VVLATTEAGYRVISVREEDDDENGKFCAAKRDYWKPPVQQCSPSGIITGRVPIVKIIGNLVRRAET